MDTEKKKSPKPPKLPAGFRSLRAEKDVKEKNMVHEYDNRPSISFTEKELPEIKEWKIGETYEVTIRIEQTGTRIEDYSTNKGKIVSNFKVDAVSIGSDKEGKSEKKK